MVLLKNGNIFELSIFWFFVDFLRSLIKDTCHFLFLVQYSLICFVLVLSDAMTFWYCFCVLCKDIFFCLINLLLFGFKVCLVF